MSHGPAFDAQPGGTESLESVLFACLEVPEAERAAAFTEACERHPALADPLRRCWQRIRGLQQPFGAPTQIAGYRILRRLGGGGMGVVYLAEQENLGRKVALKLIRSDLLDSEQARERFQREALAASRLEHPGLCPVFEVGEVEGVPFMVMPWLEGMTLATRLAELRQAEGETNRVFASSSARRDLVAVVSSVARASHHAHEQGLVHRDIKPGNIMLLPDGRPMLLDFGLARDERLDAPTLTRTGERVGTPAYMAPEQIREGATIDRRTDVYALGIVLYEVVLLAAPFVGGDLLGLREQILTGIRPATLRRGVPHDLASIILKAADPDPARRYATAAALADDLDRFARLLPVHARRLGVVGRSVRWIRRHPVASGLLFTLAGALCLAGIALAASLREQRRFEALSLQGDSRAAESTDARLALQRALEADTLDPTSRSLVQLNRAVQVHRELGRWDLDAWILWVAFSPDKKRLVAVTQAGSMHVFDVATRALVAAVSPPQPMRAECAAMAPDGSYVVAGGTNQLAFLWRPATGERKVLAGAHQSNVWDLAIAADGRTIYTGDQDGRVARWSDAGELLEPFPWLVTAGPARAMRLRGDTLVVTSAANVPTRNELVVAPTAGGTPVRTRLPGPGLLLEFSPETDRIFLARLGIDGLFDTAGHTARLPGTRNTWFCGDLSARGDRVAIGHRGSVRVFDLRGAGRGVDGIANVPYRDCQVGEGPVALVQFSDDGQRLFARAADNVVHVLDGHGELFLRLPGLFKHVRGLAYDPDSQVLATGDDWGAVRLWDVRACRAMPPEFQVPGGRFNGFATDAADKLIARRDNGRLVAFPVDGGEPWHIEAGDAILNDARVSRNGRLLATGPRRGNASVWDLETRERVWATPVDEATPPVGVDFLPGERLLVVTGAKEADERTCEVQIWCIRKREKTPQARFVVPKEWGRLNHGAATPDGRQVVLGSFAGRLWVLPLALEETSATFGPGVPIEVGEPIIHTNVARAGDRVVATCGDNAARIYDLRGGASAHCVPCIGHGKRLERAHFSPSGRWVVTASQDGTARIWNAATGVSEMEVVVGASSPVWDALFSPDEKVLYTISVDGVARGWLLERDRLRAAAVALAGR